MVRPDLITQVSLTPLQRGDIADAVQACWAQNSQFLPRTERYTAHLVVTTDATGTARLARMASGTPARLAGDPDFLAFNQRAMQAVLDPRCSRLPVPASLLGQDHSFELLLRE